MWLIDTSTLLLEPFSGDDIPNYAILSHTWGEGEVSFQEFTQLNEATKEKTTSKVGYRKIVATCDLAKKDGHQYAWVDTCCIDKTSSAELTEAINSMFGWYRQSQICYVYLIDFAGETIDISARRHPSHAEFQRCRWFSRGWCLQELLAPRHIQFFNQKWQELGTKSSLGRLISAATGVPDVALVVPPKKDIEEFPIATRLSWMANRKTTRIEDISYSLLGILNVAMPLLYGEGDKAFLRLQDEVIRKYNDLSIFAWADESITSTFLPILADRPSRFSSTPTDHTAINTGSEVGHKLRTQFSLTNQGVVFAAAKLHCQRAVPGYRHQYLLFLDYWDHSFYGKGRKQWYLVLQKVGPGLYVRLQHTPERWKAFQKQPPTSQFSEALCIVNNLSPTIIRQLALWERYAVRVRWKPWENLGQRYWHVRTAQPRASWDVATNQFLVEMAYDNHMYIEFIPGNYESNPTFKYFVLVFRVGDHWKRNPVKVSVRIASAEEWQGVNVAMFGFQGRGALALGSLAEQQNADANRIALAGYDISVSVRLVAEPDEQPYHLVYLDWETKSSPLPALLSPTPQAPQV